MADPETTDWLAIRAAASGDHNQRESFAHRYDAWVRGRLEQLVGGVFGRDDLDDAVQEVFVECFKRGGVLAAADPERIGGFRAFLNGVIQNVARRLGERAAIRRKHVRDQPIDSSAMPPTAGLTPSQHVDRQWALQMVRAAASVMRERAERLGDSARRRVELLQARFEDGLPIRDIAARWQMRPETLHHQYSRAREEFRQALLQVLGADRALAPAEMEAECQRLLQLLSP